jgi:hypothetical protein
MNPELTTVPPDADAVWLWVILGIVGLIALTAAICFDSKGHPRKWLAKRMGMDPME